METRELFEWGNVRLVPIVHNRVEFALEVRRQFASFEPDIVAIECPPTIGEKIVQGIKRLPHLSVVYYEEDDHTFIYLPLEPTGGQIEAARLALSKNLPIHFIDRDTEGYPIDRTPMPDPYSLKRIGYWHYCHSYLKTYPEGLRTPQDQLRERTMAYHLQQLDRDGKRVLFVGGLAHLPGLLRYLDKPQVQVIGRKSRDGVMLAHLHRESSREIMTEIPFFAALYERFRGDSTMAEPDRLKAIDQLIDRASRNHLKKNKEEVTVSQLRIFNRFVLNYALLSGFLAPDLYQILVAARGAVDDNFAYEVWDVVIEGFGDYLKKRALKEKSEEQSRIVPFVSSMMDGIDIRETLRNWQEGTIYVRENIPLKGKVGSVVVIFDPDLPDAEGQEAFPWRVTWLGEHNQESDMAFYSTPAGEVVIGPGISRCQYGGFMLTFPPLRVYDIWKDSFFDFARNKPERLLLAALDYSLERHVAYVASTPPSALCTSFASTMRKKIIYLPIGMFSPVTLKKTRQFHVLDGHPVRQYANRYI